MNTISSVDYHGCKQGMRPKAHKRMQMKDFGTGFKNLKECLVIMIIINRNPLNKNKIVSMKFIEKTKTGQGKWRLILIGERQRTIWTNLVEKSEV